MSTWFLLRETLHQARVSLGDTLFHAPDPAAESKEFLRGTGGNEERKPMSQYCSACNATVKNKNWRRHQRRVHASSPAHASTPYQPAGQRASEDTASSALAGTVVGFVAIVGLVVLVASSQPTKTPASSLKSTKAQTSSAASKASGLSLGTVLDAGEAIAGVASDEDSGEQRKTSNREKERPRKTRGRGLRRVVFFFRLLPGIP